jgi:hypothetical protein
LQNIGIVGEDAGGMQHYARFEFGVEALVGVAPVVVEVVCDRHLRIQAACENYFEQVDVFESEFLAA